MSAPRDGMSWSLLAVALGCLVVALFPQWHEWVDPATGERVSEQRLGLWSSPVHQTVRREAAHGGFTWRGGINWLSWSSLLVVVGVGCLEASRRRWRSSSGNGKTPPEAADGSASSA